PRFLRDLQRPRRCRRSGCWPAQSPGDVPAMSELRDLYQEVVLDHAKRPRNFGSIAAARHRAFGDNPFCGDKVMVTLTIANGHIADARFEGAGCAISTASAS